VQDPSNLKRLAEDSTTSAWTEYANFAVIVLSDPRYRFHSIDAGRAAQDMQIAAWNFGVISCVFTGIKEEDLRKDFNIPSEMNPSIVVGFGYPVRKIVGRKNRKPLDELVYLERYGSSFARGMVSKTTQSDRARRAAQGLLD